MARFWQFVQGCHAPPCKVYKYVVVLYVCTFIYRLLSLPLTSYNWFVDDWGFSSHQIYSITICCVCLLNLIGSQWSWLNVCMQCPKEQCFVFDVCTLICRLPPLPPAFYIRCLDVRMLGCIDFHGEYTICIGFHKVSWISIGFAYDALSHTERIKKSHLGMSARVRQHRRQQFGVKLTGHDRNCTILAICLRMLRPMTTTQSLEICCCVLR